MSGKFRPVDGLGSLNFLLAGYTSTWVASKWPEILPESAQPMRR